MQRPSHFPTFVVTSALIISSIIVSVWFWDEHRGITKQHISFQNFSLDLSFPAQPLPAYTFGLSAIALATDNKGNIQLHISQRNISYDPIFALSLRGEFLYSYGKGMLTQCHGLSSSNYPRSHLFQPSSIWCADGIDHVIKQVDFVYSNQSSASSLSTPVSVQLSSTIGTINKAGNRTNPIEFGNLGEVIPSSFDFGGNREDVLIFSDGDGGINNRVGLLRRMHSSLNDISNNNNNNNHNSPSDSFQVQMLFGSTGSAIGQFRSPHSISYDSTNRVLAIADRDNSRLQFWKLRAHLASDPIEPIFISEFSNTNCFPSEFFPSGVRIDLQRQLMIVVDVIKGFLYFIRYGSEISKHHDSSTIQCQILQRIAIEPSRHPHLLEIDPQAGDVYVAGVGNPITLQRYRRL